MEDYIIDTNVLLLASAIDPGSPFKDSDHVSEDHQQEVLNWLIEFRKDGQRKIVLDKSFKIWDEYHNKLTRGRDFGALVMADKLQSARFVEIEFDVYGHARVPAYLEKIDRSDRKFVAVALKDLFEEGLSSIVNAADSDWRECEEELNRAGITVKHLIKGLGKKKIEKVVTKKRPTRKKR